jgi:arylsulfatase
MDKPNIVLIMVDQMRGDCLGIGGHPYVKTPHLDTLARNGIRCTSAFSATPTCIPARAALFTGMSQRSHGRVGYQDCVPWNYSNTLAGELSKAGYYTQCVGKMHVHPERFLCGFHNVELHNGYLHCYRRQNTPMNQHQKYTDDYLHWLNERCSDVPDITDTGLDCNSWVARPWIFREELHPTNWVVTRCLDFLRRRDITRPFFLMASFVRPHPPFDAPQCYFDMYRHMNFDPPLVGDWAEKTDDDLSGRDYACFKGILDPELQRQAQVGYYACITHIDHQIGRLLQGLYEAGVSENTVIIFTSDHGEMLGEHNLFRKAWPFQGSVSIPFIVSGPTPLIGTQGRVVDEVVELRDIMPTILDLTGIPIPNTVEGKSLMAFLRGEDINWRTYIHGEHSGWIYSNHYIATKEDKYIWFSQTGEELYFRLSEDPHELHNPRSPFISKTFDALA